MFSLRRSGAWVTGLRNKYRKDPFLRATINVVSLQLFYAVTLLIFVALAFNYLHREITRTLLESIVSGIEVGSIGTETGILEAVNTVKTEHLYSVIAFTLLITATLSFLIAKVALIPTRDALKTQKRFISDVAHELRTPLSIIKTNNEVALLNEAIDPRMKKTLKSNIEELDRASEIINNLLSLSNLVNPGHLKFEEVDLGNIVDEAVKKLTPLAQSKYIQITSKKMHPRSVWGNTTALEQIVTNLLKNSINYTSEGGSIFITVGPDYRKNIRNIFLTVQDTGIGISREDLFHIFEPFYRSEQSRSRASGSSGLGLTIVSELIRLHSGKISIKSAPGRGTTATVVLPGSTKNPDAVSKEEKISEISVDFLNRKKDFH